MKRFLIMLLTLASINAWAQNTGFESGNLSGWTTAGGDVTISTGVNNVTYGGGKTWTITPYGTYMAQLYPSGSVTFDSTVNSLGLNSTENSAIRSFMQANAGGGSPTPTNATWIKKTVSLQAGVTYSFAWNYLSTDYTPFNDGSMMTLTHTTNAGVTPTLNNLQQRYALLGFTNPGSGNYSTDSYGSTGWQLATFTVPESGDYVLGFATFNLGDTVLSPQLFIDEMQGATLLNSQPFAPVAPNAGSSAPTTPSGPTLCCGGSDSAFSANAGFATRAGTWSNNGDNKVIVEQIGNYNSTSVTQTGRNNYTESHVTGSNNTVTVNQQSVTGTQANYIESTVAGNSNSVTMNQNSTGGAKGILLNANNNSNTVVVQQNNAGNHYAEITLTGSNKSVNITQEGSANHMAKIELSGGATSITATQSGSTQLHYSITHNCATSSCSPITVTQGQ